MLPTDIAYCAGLIDGEGCIRIKKDKGYRCQSRATPGYHASIHVRMVDPAAIEFIASMLGGKFYREKKAHSEKGRLLYHWSISDRQAETALRFLVPFLRVKRRQAEVNLRLRDLQKDGRLHRTKVVGTRTFPNSHGTIRTVNNLAFSDEYVARCETLFQECKRLNRVGLAALEE